MCRVCQAVVQFKGPRYTTTLKRNLESKRCRNLNLPESPTSESDESLNFDIDKEKGLAKCLTCLTLIRIKSSGNSAALRRHLNSKAHSSFHPTQVV